MTTPEALLELYNRVLSSQSTELIRDTEASLLEAEVQESFLVSNSAILCSQAVPQAVRKFAVVYLAKAAKRIGRDKSTQRASIALQHFLGLLANPMVDLQMKGLLVPCLQAILSASTFKGLREEFKMQYVNILNGAENMGDGDLDYASIVFCGKALLHKDSFSEELRELVRITSPSLLKIGIRLCNRFRSEENKQSLLYIVILLKEYSELIKNYFKKMALLQIQSIKIVYLKELQEFITNALDLSHRENTTNLSIYIAVNNDDNISKLLNIFKANIIVMLTSSMRLIINYTKHPKLIATNILIMKMPQLITIIIKSTSTLLQITPYYQLPLQIKLIQTLSDVLNFLINCLRLNYFYEPLAEHRHELIESIILPCLSTTPQDVQNFYQDPTEFVESSIQIINRNPPPPSQQDIRQYQTLRTLSAQILNAICTFQDGTLSLVTEMTINVLEDKVAGDKTLTLLVLSVLSPLFKNRKDLCAKVGEVIIKLFQCCAIPVVSSIKKKEDMEYAFLLMTLAKMFSYLSQIFKDLVGKIYKVGVAVIQSPSVSEAHRFFVFQLFNKLAHTTQGQPYAQDLLLIYNHLLNTNESPSFALLDSYYFLIKYNSEQFKRNPSQILQGIRLSCLHIEREVNHPQPVRFLLSKCWNMIRQIGENDDFIPTLIPQIEAMILPLMKYIDGVRNLDFEEDVFMLLTSFIEKGKTVTANQLKMMEILPRIFYGVYECRFGYSFRVIQLLIYYGSAILSTDLQAIYMLIEMSVTSISSTERNKKPMSESENCEGVLILQSLVTKCGAVFPAEYWTTIIKCCLKKLQQKITFKFLSANLYALLSLAIIHSHRFFSYQQNQILLGQILSKIQLFDKVQYAPKVIIAGLSQILYHSQNQFIQRRFSHILDLIITMLEITTSRKENYFDDEQPQQEKQYCNSIIMVKNDLKDLDQFTHFRMQVDKLKAKNLPLLQKSVGGLPKAKKDFLTHILRVQRVANEPRQIYRIKR